MQYRVKSFQYLNEKVLKNFLFDPSVLILFQLVVRRMSQIDSNANLTPFSYIEHNISSN